MPSSYPHNILPILQIIGVLKPKSILDIGIGRGKYGFLIKEYWSETKVDGVEVFEPYITNLQREIYNKIFVGNVLEMDLGDYDLYLLIDTIEHWGKDEAYRLINKLLKKGKVLISTPKKFISQSEYDGNKWEVHKTFWNIDDFKDYKFEICPNELSLIIILYDRLVQSIS